MNEMSLGNIVFDMDGTLIYSMHAQADIFASLLEEEAFLADLDPKTFYLASAGRPIEVQFAKFVSNKSNVEKLVKRFDIKIKKIEPKFYSDVHEALIELKRYYALFVSSGATQETVNHKLGYLKMSGEDEDKDDYYFKRFLGSEEGLVKGKDHFDLIEENTDLTPEDFNVSTIFIGDSLHDIKIGKEAGVKTIGRIGICEKEQFLELGADDTINNLTELVEKLKQENKSSEYKHISELKVNYKSNGDSYLI